VSGLYVPVLAAHVLVSVLGVGSVAAVAVVAATARRARSATASALPAIGSLLRYSAISLAVMLVTGILLDFIAHGAFHEHWWLRGSVLLLIATGALNGRARRALRQDQEGASEALVGRIERMAYGMCVLVGAIVVLMEVKPF
jgi:hypothetical protein